MSLQVSAITSQAASRPDAGTPAPAVLADAPLPAAADAVAAPRPSLLPRANPTLELVARRVAAETPAPRFPRNLCYRGDCGVEMERIWNAFNAAGPVDASQIPSVFSGNMFWKSSSYNPNHAHFGGVLLDRQAGGELTFNGRWTFFGPGNPYTNTTLEEARREWANRPLPVQDRGDHLYIDANPRTNDPRWVPLEYWLRQDATTRDIYVVGFFGNGQFAVGQLRANANQ